LKKLLHKKKNKHTANYNYPKKLHKQKTPKTRRKKCSGTNKNINFILININEKEKINHGADGI
jgi:hypothetical protein